jgi:outer membrane protein OmpA-like peptidoglycan-associated protein
MHTMSIRAALATVALLLSTSLAACGSTDAETGSGIAEPAGNTTNCEPTAQPTIKPDTPTIAILAAEGETLGSYDQDTDVIINTAKTAKARVIVNGVSSSPNAPNLLSNVILEGEGSNNLARTKDLNCKAAIVTEAIDTLKTGDGTKSPNVFSALNALSGNLTHNPSKQPIDVVLLTPLAAQGGGIDLSNPATLADPVSAINTLAAKGLIPRCENWRIYGVSPSTGFSDIAAAQLKDFWIRYTEKCGGTLVAWADHLATFPALNAILTADTSQIRVEHKNQNVTGTLGSDVLFDSNGWILLDSAAPALAELLGLTTTYPGRIVITGHVNPIVSANPEANTTLSLRRATAVRDWLVAHNVDSWRVTVIAKGAEEPLYPSPRTDEEAAANRRVVIEIHPDV